MMRINCRLQWHTILFSASLLLVLLACDFSDNETDNGCLPDVDTENIDVQVQIVRTDSTLFACRSKEEVARWLEQYPDFAERYFLRSRWPSDSLLVEELYRLIDTPSLDSVYQEVQAAYGDMQWLKKEFEEAFKRVKYHFPGFTPPVIYTFFTGYGSGATVTRTPDLMVSGDMAVIGMEFFMGPGYRFQPPYPLYIARRYHRGSIVPFVLQMLAPRFIDEDPEDKSMLADMIFYGKAFYFVKNMLPCLPDSTLFGYTEKQVLTLQANEQAIWRHYIDKNVLYETSHLVKKDYVDPAPFCYPIGKECPGEVGRWTGYLIVRRYHERHPELSLKQVLAEKDAKKILRESKYKGNYYTTD
ncbi:gliding motility lipoprotein GldB [Thermonema rossianum]|uniref:gliding motility lipoprotein GldB n=1 Tax=Thermonema rossianum TaxID=55505 RepID=UPI0012FB854E|nr:gliding motility lipoprotein GldB [Thermonema rossianum]